MTSRKRVIEVCAGIGLAALFLLASHRFEQTCGYSLLDQIEELDRECSPRLNNLSIK